MNDLSKEMKQRIEEASKDAAWLEKLRTAVNREEYKKLLGEKGIEALLELREAFNTAGTGNTVKLEDNDLQNVSGGITFFPCMRDYDHNFCKLTMCPHLNEQDNTPNDKYFKWSCDLGFWYSFYKKEEDDYQTNRFNFY